MNAQSKKLNQLVAAILMSMALGTAWAGSGNSITFEGATDADQSNGINNTGNIDANDATDAVIDIRQISTAITPGLANSAEMNQVGVYTTVGESPLVIKGENTAVKIGQGVKFTGDPANGFDSANENGSVNNLVKGNIGTATSTDAKVYISQTGGVGVDSDDKADTVGRSVNITEMKGGTLRINQTAGAQAVDVTSMTTGQLTINQNGDGQKATIVSFMDGKTKLEQGEDATNSTLTLRIWPETTS